MKVYVILKISGDRYEYNENIYKIYPDYDEALKEIDILNNEKNNKIREIEDFDERWDNEIYEKLLSEFKSNPNITEDEILDKIDDEYEKMHPHRDCIYEYHSNPIYRMEEHDLIGVTKFI